MNKEQSKAINDFEAMRDLAELKALRNVSFERILTDEELNKMRKLAGKVLGVKK